MIQIPEYDQHNTDTLVILRESDVLSASEAEDFRQALVRIGGKTFDGQPNLVMRWGVTYVDPMQAVPDQIKYLDIVHNGVQLGERRFFIEIHRGPEFLIKSGRYRVRHDPDDIQDFYFCKGCDAELVDPTVACPQCGSTRNRLKQVRTTNGAELLRDFPRAGCYDYWLRLERGNLTYHPPDGEALQAIEAIWDFEKNHKRDALRHADAEQERRKMIREQRQQTTTRLHFGSGLILPAHLGE